VDEVAERILRDQIRLVPDWPKPGVAFQDLTGLMADARSFRTAIDGLAGLVDALGGGRPIDEVVGIEARGFPYGAALAHHLGAGFVTVRKAGKLPGLVHAREYELEYGAATLELHRDALGPGRRIVIIDDVLATGGTAEACTELVRMTGAEVVAALFIMELLELGGRAALQARGVAVAALLSA
jgi:adenine phosphoribosyltransferase